MFQAVLKNSRIKFGKNFLEFFKSPVQLLDKTRLVYSDLLFFQSTLFAINLSIIFSKPIHRFFKTHTSFFQKQSVVFSKAIRRFFKTHPAFFKTMSIMRKSSFLLNQDYWWSNGKLTMLLSVLTQKDLMQCIIIWMGNPELCEPQYC